MNIYVSPSMQDWNKGVGDYGTEESRMNQLADLVCPLLQYNGFTVFRNKPTMTLEQIVKDSNAKIGKNGLHLALHTNAGGGVGTEIWYYSGSIMGKKIAEDIYSFVAPLTPSNDRGVKSNKEFRELNGTDSVAVILESVFHDNPADARYLIDHMQDVASAIVRGVCKHYGVPFKAIVKVAEKKEKTGTKYRVITGSFSDKENADKRVKELKAKGFDSFVEIK